jgi:uncharacterized protein
MGSMSRTIILYHGSCPDGTAGAYAAWKKFGDGAEYIPLSRHEDAPIEACKGADLYFIDFMYDRETMDKFLAVANSLTALDHHAGVEDVTRAMPSFVYDVDRSGAGIAWEYFHPGTKVPLLLQYIQDGDLYRFLLPESHAMLSYIYTKPFDFASFDTLSAELETDAGREKALALGRAYSEHNEILMQQIANNAELVTFEGHVVYLASTSRQFASYVGNTLAKKRGPLALVASVRPEGLRVSLRTDGSVDVAKIAQKFGGNGHPNAAAFSLAWGAAIPWTPYHENTVD